MIKNNKELEQILVPLVIGAVFEMCALIVLMFRAWYHSVEGGPRDPLQINSICVIYLIGMILAAVSFFLAFRGRRKPLMIASAVVTSQCIVCFVPIIYLACYILFG